MNMSRLLYLAYLSILGILIAAGFFLPDWPWWVLGLIGTVAMLPVIVADLILSARQKRNLPR